MRLQYAPIVIFTYKRLWHLQKSINSLKKNKLSRASNLFIFSDGPKNKSEFDKINNVRSYLHTISGFKSIKIIKRNKNLGLSRNIIQGLNTIFKKFNKAIILEDDLVLDSFFLNYINDGLNLYENSKKVASIHGYNYSIKFKNNIPSHFFIRGADCWGWGTWKRSWNYFEKNGKKLKKLIDDSKQKKEFNFNNSYDFYQMLLNQINGKNDSWAIRWYASIFVKNMFTLYPKISYVKNIGLDKSGTHGAGFGKKKFISMTRKKYSKIDKNLKISENYEAKMEMIKYFQKTNDTKVIKLLKKIYYFFK